MHAAEFGSGAGNSEDDDAETSVPATRAAPVVFSSMHEVEEFWDQQAHYVSDLCKVDVTVARNLLKEHGHDIDAAITNCLVNVRCLSIRQLNCTLHVTHLFLMPLCPVPLLVDDMKLLMCVIRCLCLLQKGNRELTAEASSAKDAAVTCCVCFQAFMPSSENNVVLPCGHAATCSRCWGAYIMTRLEDGQAANIQCTEPGCTMPVPLAEAKKVVPARRYDPYATVAFTCEQAPLKWFRAMYSTAPLIVSRQALPMRLAGRC